MQPIARRVSISPGSDPPSGVRPRCVAIDVGGFARRHIARTDRWARELGVPEQDVEELLQDAFLVVLQKADTIRPELLESWFRGALLNQKRHLLRAKAIAGRFEPLLQAHLAVSGSPSPAPDADVLRRQAISAAFWLVDQVHSSRRQVVERHLFEGEPLPQIAESMNLRPGTVFARWERGKDDMRAALERLRKKQGPARWLVLVAALVEALWLWLLAEARDFAGGGAELRARAFGFTPDLRELHQERPTSAARGHHRRVRARSWAAAALAVLSLAVLSHGALPLPRPPARLEASLDATAGFLEREAQREDGTVHDTKHADTPVPSAAPKDGRKAAPTAEAKPRAAARPPSHRAALSAADLEMARILLLQASTSTNTDVARAALRRYRRMFPDNPYPALYERAKQVEHAR